MLRLEDIVIVDSLNARKVAGMRETIAAACAWVLYLALYSPDFNPIDEV